MIRFKPLIFVAPELEPPITCKHSENIHLPLCLMVFGFHTDATHRPKSQIEMVDDRPQCPNQKL